MNTELATQLIITLKSIWTALDSGAKLTRSIFEDVKMLREKIEDLEKKLADIESQLAKQKN